MTLQYSDSPEYRLRSFIVHTGTSQQGHYTAYSQSQENCWYTHDDEQKPLLVSTRAAETANPYCLFYERQLP